MSGGMTDRQIQLIEDSGPTSGLVDKSANDRPAYSTAMSR